MHVSRMTVIMMTAMKGFVPKVLLILGSLVVLSACDSPEIKTSGFIEGEEFLVWVVAAGEVEQVFVQAGDRVERGQALARLDKEQRSLYERLEEVYELGGISKAELDRAEKTTDYGERLAALNAGFKLSDLKRMGDAETRLKTSTSPTDKSVLVAPAQGIVTKRFINVGERLDAGSPAFIVTDVRLLVLKAALTERELSTMKLGQNFQVTVDDLPNQSFEGTLIEIAEDPEFTPTVVVTKEDELQQVYAIKLKVANPEGILRPGMIGKARIQNEGGVTGL